MTRRMSIPEVSAWCRRWLGSPVERVLFEAGFVSRVVGVRLGDGREVVTTIRGYTPRLLGAARVQRQLWQAGYPCPEPLTGPTHRGGWGVNAEALVGGGSV